MHTTITPYTAPCLRWLLGNNGQPVPTLVATHALRGAPRGTSAPALLRKLGWRFVPCPGVPTLRCGLGLLGIACTGKRPLPCPLCGAPSAGNTYGLCATCLVAPPASVVFGKPHVAPNTAPSQPYAG